MNKDGVLDEVCSEVAESIEHSPAGQIVEKKVLHCNRCDFMAVIRIAPFDIKWARRIIRKLIFVLGMSFSVTSEFATERGHYFEFDLSDKDINEGFIVRLAHIISIILMVEKNSDGYLTLNLYRHARKKKGFIHEYHDYATDCSPLHTGRLAEFLMLHAERKVTVGCIGVIGDNTNWKCDK